MAVSVSSSRLVGRERELAELEEALLDAADGRPALAFVAGESGVGKTRLVCELARRAEERGLRVLSGDSVELAEGQLAYAPLVTALRQLARERDPVLEALSPQVRAELAALLPGLGERGPRDRRDDQARIFEALLTLLDALAAEAPVLLVIEDLHWADASTRAFLRFLSAALADEPIVVVATYRPDELHRRHPLRPLLAELERTQRARRIELPRLDRAELAELLARLTGNVPADDLVDRLYARSEGNPLYTEELLAAGADGRGSLPASLAAALAVRIERLGADAQEVVRVLSAAGQLEHETLGTVAGLEPRALNEALREAVSSHIVQTGEADRYLFRHALLREAVYDDLLPGERAELHRALAAALERPAAGAAPAGPQRAARIAHHYLAAGDQPAALVAAVRAGTAAMDVQAYEEGAQLFERALELWSRVPGAAALVGADEAEVLERAASCHLYADDLSRAEALTRRALAAVDAAAEPRRTARLFGLLSRAEWASLRQDDAVATMQRALDLLDGDGPSRERVALLAQRAKRLMVQSKYRKAVVAARQALTEQAELEPGEACRSDEAAALNAQGVALIALGDLEQGKAALHRAVALARDEDDQQDLTVAVANLADALHMAGRTGEALDVARRGYAELSGVGARRWLALGVAQYAFDAGHWEESAAAVGDVDRRGPQAGNTELERRLRHAELALGRDEREAAREHLRHAADLGADSREPQYLGVLGDLQAELAVREDDIPAARAAVDEALDRIEFCSEDILRIVRVAASGLFVEASAAQRARDVGDAAAQAEALERAEALIMRARAAAEDGQGVEAAYAASAEAAYGRALGRDDAALWAAAADAWEALERPYPAARARWHQAEALVAAGDREGAAAPVAAALAAAERLGATWLSAEAESLAARGRLRLAAESPQDGDGDGAALADEDPFGLTPRERQVLALVAAGATNREIGRQLYMAEKTASVHVSRILVKLDVRSRTEAAGVAHRLGLDVAA